MFPIGKVVCASTIGMPNFVNFIAISDFYTKMSKWNGRLYVYDRNAKFCQFYRDIRL